MHSPEPRIVPPTPAPLALKAKLFRGLSDPSRLSILEALREGERSVGDLAGAAGLSQPNTSNHLACLLDCGLVAREQRGRRVIYRLAGERVAALLADAEELLGDDACSVDACPRYEEEGARASSLPRTA